MNVQDFLSKLKVAKAAALSSSFSNDGHEATVSAVRRELVLGDGGSDEEDVLEQHDVSAHIAKRNVKRELVPTFRLKRDNEARGTYVSLLSTDDNLPQRLPSFASTGAPCAHRASQRLGVVLASARRKRERESPQIQLDNTPAVDVAPTESERVLYHPASFICESTTPPVVVGDADLTEPEFVTSSSTAMVERDAHDPAEPLLQKPPSKKKLSMLERAKHLSGAGNV